MSGKKYKILVVEDEEYIVKKIETGLNKFGYEVIGTVETGERAIEIVKKTKPDLVLMDILLKSEKDGIETAREIKKMQDIPVVFITGCGKDDFIERINGMLQVKYLLKPFREIELHNTIKLALDLN